MQKVVWTQGAKVSEKPLAPPKTAFAPVQNGVAPVQEAFRRPLPPASKRPFAPSPKHFWGEFSLFGRFPRPAASQPKMAQQENTEVVQAHSLNSFRQIEERACSKRTSANSPFSLPQKKAATINRQQATSSERASHSREQQKHSNPPRLFWVPLLFQELSASNSLPRSGVRFCSDQKLPTSSRSVRKVWIFYFSVFSALSGFGGSGPGIPVFPCFRLFRLVRLSWVQIWNSGFLSFRFWGVQIQKSGVFAPEI